MPLFFISYSRKDASELAIRLERDIGLVNSNNIVFLDRNAIEVGQNFEQRINYNIENCDYFILLITEGSRTSDWVKREVNYAQSSELKTGLRKLFVIKTPAIPYPDFVPEKLQFLELSDNWSVDFHKLMSGIKANYSFYSINQKIKIKNTYYDIKLALDYVDEKFKPLVSGVEYRFDNEFMQQELKYKKVVLCTNPRNDFGISFWTNQTVTIFIVIYLNNTKQINIIHKVEIGN